MCVRLKIVDHCQCVNIRLLRDSKDQTKMRVFWEFGYFVIKVSGKCPSAKGKTSSQNFLMELLW